MIKRRGMYGVRDADLPTTLTTERTAMAPGAWPLTHSVAQSLTRMCTHLSTKRLIP